MPNSKRANVSVAVVGAGTAGLAAASLLQRHGVSATIFERFDASTPVGAGLMLQPTGLACLAALGVDHEAIALGRVVEGVDGLSHKGRVILKTAYKDLAPNCFGLGIHRASLFSVLMAAAERAAVVVKTTLEIVAAPVAGAQRVLIDTAGQSHGPFDLVIDASGVRSKLRRALGKIRLDRPYPFGALWAVVPEPAGWPTPDRLTQRYRSAREMVGLLPLGTPPGFASPQMAFFWSMPTADFPPWQQASLARWRGTVEALWPTAAESIAHLNQHQDFAFATYADMWLVRPDEPGLIFIGDASRSASPQLGQGANMALIDALVLSRALVGARATELPRRLEAYAQQRRFHTRFYGLASWALTPFFQSRSGLAGSLRDATFKPLATVPYIRREMVRTLAGMKTGLFSSFDPGDLDPAYRLAPKRRP